MRNGKYELVIAPDNFTGKKYRNRYCYEHILRYWEYYGVLPKDDEVIHHKDGNTHNNAIDNLELISRSYHSSYHGESRKAYYVELKCPACGRHFIRARRNTYLVKTVHKVTCCSKKCVGMYTNLDAKTKLERVQKMFIREFQE